MIFHGASRKLAKIRWQKSKMNCVGKGNKMKERLQAIEGASSTCNFRKWPNCLVVGAFYKSLGNTIISGVQTARGLLETNARRVLKKLPLKKRGKILFFWKFCLIFWGCRSFFGETNKRPNWGFLRLLNRVGVCCCAGCENMETEAEARWRNRDTENTGNYIQTRAK